MSKDNIFYLFDQNNSGGSFHTDAKLAEYVYVEANDADEANRIAESLGIYFDGVRKGKDCKCCGDRWSRVRDGDGVTEAEAEGMRVFKGSKMRVYRKAGNSHE